MSKKHTSSGLVPISYYAVPGSGAPVVFVHAFPLNHHMWEAQLNDGSGQSMLALDLRGFGDSGPTPGQTTVADYAADVRAVLAAEGVEQAHLAGCSMGGYVLMEILRQDPQIALSLALIDTRAGADTDEARAGRLETAQKLRRGLAEDRQAFEEAMLGKLLGGTSRAQRPQVVDRVRRLMSTAGNEGIASALEAMAARPDSVEALASYTGPALVVHGTEDALIPTEEARKMSETLPRGELLLLPGAGHLPSLESAEALSRGLHSLWERTH